MRRSDLSFEQALEEIQDAMREITPAQTAARVLLKEGAPHLLESVFDQIKYLDTGLLGDLYLIAFALQNAKELGVLTSTRQFCEQVKVVVDLVPIVKNRLSPLGVQWIGNTVSNAIEWASPIRDRFEQVSSETVKTLEESFQQFAKAIEDLISFAQSPQNEEFFTHLAQVDVDEAIQAALSDSNSPDVSPPGQGGDPLGFGLDH